MGRFADGGAGALGGACAPNSVTATTQQPPIMRASAPMYARTKPPRTKSGRRIDVCFSSSLKDRIMPSAQPEFDVAFRTSKVYTFQLADTIVRAPGESRPSAKI